ncbi:MAG: hypothetical protein ACRC92_16775 [Peptostreptococcaceae bacterium]
MNPKNKYILVIALAIYSISLVYYNVVLDISPILHIILLVCFVAMLLYSLKQGGKKFPIVHICGILTMLITLFNKYI